MRSDWSHRPWCKRVWFQFQDSVRPLATHFCTLEKVRNTNYLGKSNLFHAKTEFVQSKSLVDSIVNFSNLIPQNQILLPKGVPWKINIFESCSILENMGVSYSFI